MTLYDNFINTIVSGLNRKSIQTCSKWAETYRVMGAPYPGLWSFKHHPWLREMHDSKAELNVGQKAAQMGFTETVLNISLFNIDVLRESVMYILPSKIPDAADFSSARFDVALELSEHLANLFTDSKNIGHKRAGSANLYIRGSKSRAGLKSVPAGFLVFDEVDEMNQKNIPLAFERSSGQPIKKAWMISTPTADDIGINEYYKNTTQENFVFKCPACSRFISLEFPDNLQIVGESVLDPRLRETHLICKLCKNKLEHRDKVNFLAKGVWEPLFKGREARGFGVSQLYSTTVRPFELAVSYFKSKNNPADEQEFYNSKLGKTCTPEGTRINDTHIQECTGDHRIEPIKGDNIITMGIDVGTHLHVWIDRWLINSKIQSLDFNIRAFAQTIGVFEIKQFEELDNLFSAFNCHFAVCDANPERRKAFEFAMRHPGRVRLCFYGRGVYGKQINLSAERDENPEPTVTVDRTSWLDLSLGRFYNKNIAIPINIPSDAKQHLKAMVRRYKRDDDGNVTSHYIKNVNVPDHYAHARNYSEIAFPLALDVHGYHVQNIVKAP